MKQRVIASLVAIPFVLAALLARSPIPLLMLGALLMGVVVEELGPLLGPQSQATKLFQLGLFLALNTMAMSVTPNLVLVDLCVLWAAFLMGLACLASVLKGRSTTSTQLYGSFWAAAPIAALVMLHRFGGRGAGEWLGWNAVLLPILPQWAGDTAAIFAGRAFGKHPMAPTISPKKTWEGAIANALACLVVAIGLCLLMGLGWSLGIVTGLTCGTLGQMGDLAESALKRKVGVKDSGDFLPGHGGVLDRLDSLLFTALPVTTIYLLLAP